MTDNKDYISYSGDNGVIHISEEVICTIVGNAALEVEGVAGLQSSAVRDLAEIMGRKGVTKGVKVRLEEETMAADVFVVVRPDVVLAELGTAVQQAVKTAVESATGIAVSKVNVNVCGLKV